MTKDHWRQVSQGTGARERLEGVNVRLRADVAESPCSQVCDVFAFTSRSSMVDLAEWTIPGLLLSNLNHFDPKALEHILFCRQLNPWLIQQSLQLLPVKKNVFLKQAQV